MHKLLKGKRDKILTVFFIVVFLLYLYRNGIIYNWTHEIPFSPFNPSGVISVSGIIALPADRCDQTIWQHVYAPSRLFIIQPCVAMTGIIERVDKEEDGDDHIYFKPDNPPPGLTNFFNQFLAGGDIIAEPVCLSDIDIREKTIEETCRGYENRVIVPKKGTRVKMYGSLVLDKAVGWIEIHPVTNIEEINTGSF